MSGLIIAVVDDMFFASKIRAVAEAAGVEISLPRTREALIETVRATKPRLIIIDLHNQKFDPIALAAEFKSDEEVRLLGFFSHVHTELQRNALAAGFDQVIPRSVFARDLAKILAADDAD
jgi:DNA-binding NarL/FixJ family response regulator